jgi:ABC-type transporter Mla MlaB component
MPIEIKNTKNRQVCKLSGSLSIWEAAEIWRELNPLLAAVEPLTLDLGQIQECDASGIQILCQVRRAMRDTSRDIRIEAMPVAVQTALASAGFNPQAMFQPPKEV